MSVSVILGIDPGLERTGWGVVRAQGNSLSFVAGGVIKTVPTQGNAERLKIIHDGLMEVIKTYAPTVAAVEEVFVNVNAKSSLKLGQARGVALLVPELCGLSVHEYTALQVKKSVVGYGRAEKGQISHMVKLLLPTAKIAIADTADALAVAITHHHTFSRFNHLQGK